MLRNSTDKKQVSSESDTPILFIETSSVVVIYRYATEVHHVYYVCMTSEFLRIFPLQDKHHKSLMCFVLTAV